MVLSWTCPRLASTHCVNCALYKTFPSTKSCGQQTNNDPPVWWVANTPYRTNLTCYGNEQTDRDPDCLNVYSKTVMIPVQIKDHSTQNKFWQNWFKPEVGQYVMRSLNLLILFGIGRKSLNGRKSRSTSLSDKKGDGQGVVITEGSELPTAYKILSNIFLSSLISYTDITADHLCRYWWHNRSTADHILWLQQILEKKWEWGFK